MLVDFSIDIILPVTLEVTLPLREIRTRNLPRGKSAVST
jgi:hypothetical protein